MLNFLLILFVYVPAVLFYVFAVVVFVAYFKKRKKINQLKKMLGGVQFENKK